MRCKNVKNYFLSYLNNELDEKTKTELEQHLKTCQDCRREFDIIKNFYESITLENRKAPDYLILNIKEKIEKSKLGIFGKLLDKIIYPATIVIGLTFGIIVANLLYTPNNYDKTITLLSNNTIIVEPLINTEGESDE